MFLLSRKSLVIVLFEMYLKVTWLVNSMRQRVSKTPKCSFQRHLNEVSVAETLNLKRPSFLYSLTVSHYFDSLSHVLHLKRKALSRKFLLECNKYSHCVVKWKSHSIWVRGLGLLFMLKVFSQVALTKLLYFLVLIFLYI